MKKRCLRVPIYKTRVWVVWDATEAELKKLYPRLKDTYPEDNEAFVVTCDHSGKADAEAIVFPKGRRVSVGTVAHECMHLTTDILTSRGSYLSNNEQEHYAYLLGWLVEEVSKLVRPRLY